MEDFITTLFRTKKEKDTLDIEDKELDEWCDRIEKINRELFDFVSENLPEKYQSRFNQIMLEYEENLSAKQDLENELYYKAGVKYGAEIYETLRNK